MERSQEGDSPTNPQFSLINCHSQLDKMPEVEKVVHSLVYTCTSCVCVCVCVSVRERECVCVCVCLLVDPVDFESQSLSIGPLHHPHTQLLVCLKRAIRPLTYHIHTYCHLPHNLKLRHLPHNLKLQLTYCVHVHEFGKQLERCFLVP